jgi:hypothetical protein
MGTWVQPSVSFRTVFCSPSLSANPNFLFKPSAGLPKVTPGVEDIDIMLWLYFHA